MGQESASTVVSALQCKECGGWIILRARSSALSCKECGGSSFCEHGRRRHRVQGVRWAGNLRARSSALYLQGVRWGVNMRARSSALISARSAVVQSICEHGRGRYDARSAVGESASTVAALKCKECGGYNLRARSSALCMQGVRWVHQSVSTVVSAMSARNAVGKEYASTVVGAVECKECRGL